MSSRATKPVFQNVVDLGLRDLAAERASLKVVKSRGRMAETLRRFRSLLGADERVDGDAVGLVPGVRGWHEAFRLIVATDRRLLVAGSPRATEGRAIVDIPYDRVTAFGVEWKYGGRLGKLTLTVAPTLGAPAQTHVITAIAPANLLSIARALRSHGVEPTDPVPVDAAESAWADLPQDRKPRMPVLDRAAMNTPEYDHALWLLLGLSALIFWVGPSRAGLSMSSLAVVLLLFPLACGVCGYMSRTSASLAYIVPLNLLVAPGFFFMEAFDVVNAMLGLTVIAFVFLRLGAALPHAVAVMLNQREQEPAPSAPRPAPGSLRYAVSGERLIRITAVMLGVFLAAAVAASAAGFELSYLRLAAFESSHRQLPVDGRSDLTGGAASVAYTPGSDLREFVTDQHLHGSLTDGARWELRSSWTHGFNQVSLSQFVFEPRLDNPAAIAAFVAKKDGEHAALAGFHVTHTVRVVDGRTGYVWNHGSTRGWWYYAAWFPQPVSTVRVECIATTEKSRFKRLCSQAMASLRFH